MAMAYRTKPRGPNAAVRTVVAMNVSVQAISEGYLRFAMMRTHFPVTGDVMQSLTASFPH